MLSLCLQSVRIGFQGLAQPVLAIDDLKVEAGARLAITGPSGSGKSTFVNLVAGLMRPDAGHIVWKDTDLTALGEGGRDRWRAANVGLVMQDFHLFPGLSAIDNILLPARLAGAGGGALKARARALMARVGLHRSGQSIETMSRGEMQRVAVARALLRQPGVLIADEPTASLDVAAGEEVGRLLTELADAEGSTLIVVSHDARLTARLPRHLTFSAGQIVADETHAGAVP